MSTVATVRVRRDVRGMRLTVRGRVVLVTLAVVLALFGSAATERAMADAPGEPVAVATRTVVAGETLWDIARSVAAPGQDVREVVDALAELNGIRGGAVMAGQQILVPVG